MPSALTRGGLGVKDFPDEDERVDEAQRGCAVQNAHSEQHGASDENAGPPAGTTPARPRRAPLFRFTDCPGSRTHRNHRIARKLICTPKPSQAICQSCEALHSGTFTVNSETLFVSSPSAIRSLGSPVTLTR